MAGKLDAFTLRHLRAWAERMFYTDDVDAKCAAVIAWLEQQDDAEHWLNEGWERTFEAAGLRAR